MSHDFPYKVSLEEGKEYFYCNCGNSKKAPFCDGSHKGSDKSPTKFKAAKSGEVYLCGCHKSGKSPYCDGTHKK